MTRPDETEQHLAIIECAVPPSVQMIAGGPRVWCLDRLLAWTEAHPTPQYSRAYVVSVTDEVVCEPGVGVYAVPRSDERARVLAEAAAALRAWPKDATSIQYNEAMVDAIDVVAALAVRPEETT